MIAQPTAIITGPIFKEHDTGLRHPENVRRLEALSPVVEDCLNDAQKRFVLLEPQEASREAITRVHSRAYVEALREFCEDGGRKLDLDTSVSEGSYKAGLYAAGGLMRGIDAVLTGEAQNAFALVRPPGHHATAERGMGFCLFNSIAVAARYLIEEQGLSRVMIIDWDVHHGNGTQDSFYNDSRVLFYSSHQSPLYPGTGFLDDIGTGRGRGYNANLPVPPNSGDEVMQAAFTQILEPLAERYQPEFILVSAGYDAHWRDALYATALAVTTPGFAEMTARVKRLADTFCNGRLALSLEGGYNPEALAAGVGATLRVLAGENPEQAAYDQGQPDKALPAQHEFIRALLKEARQLHSL